MKALIIQTDEQIENRTGEFEVATQYGHLGNDVWLWNGRKMTRDEIVGYDYRYTVTEAELIIKEGN